MLPFNCVMLPITTSLEVRRSSELATNSFEFYVKQYKAFHSNFHFLLGKLVEKNSPDASDNRCATKAIVKLKRIKPQYTKLHYQYKFQLIFFGPTEHPSPKSKY